MATSSSQTTSSSTTNIIRIKRKVTEDPTEALLLSFKRRRSGDADDGEDESIKDEIYRRTGTIPVMAAGGDGDRARNDNDATRERQLLKDIIFSNRVKLAANRRSTKLRVADVKLKAKRDKDESTRQKRENLLESIRNVDYSSSSTNGRSETNVDESSATNLPSVLPDLLDGCCATNENIWPSTMPDLFDDQQDDVRKEATGESVRSASISCNGQPMVRIKNRDSKTTSPIVDESEYAYDYYVPSDMFVDDEEVAKISNGSSSGGVGGGITDGIDIDRIFADLQRKSATSTPCSSSEEEFYWDRRLVAVFPYYPDEADRLNNDESYVVDFGDDTGGDRARCGALDDDADSNAESNPANEYPDSDYDRASENDGDDRDPYLFSKPKSFGQRRSRSYNYESDEEDGSDDGDVEMKFNALKLGDENDEEEGEAEENDYYDG